MNHGKRLIAAAAIVATLALVCCGQARTWTDATGKYSIQAELVEVQGGKVTLKKPDGRSITVPLDKLSAADQAYAKRHTPTSGRAAGSTGQPLWTLDVAKMKIPDQPAGGLIHGHPFKPDRAQFKQDNDWLELRQGKDLNPDLSLVVVVFAKEGQTLEGRTFRITPKGSHGITPHVILQWRGGSNTFTGVMDDEKYAMILEYGKKTGGKLPGRIYVCLPDKEHSVVAGTFAVPAPAQAVQESNEMEAIKGAVIVEVSGVNSDADRDQMMHVLTEILPEMVDPGSGRNFSATQNLHGGVWKFTVAPVKNVKAFARKIKFGKVTGVQGRTIKVQYGK